MTPPMMAPIGVLEFWFGPAEIAVEEASVVDVVVLELDATDVLDDVLEVEYMAPAMVETCPLLSSTWPRASSSVPCPASQQAVLLKPQQKDPSGQEVRRTPASRYSKASVLVH